MQPPVAGSLDCGFSGLTLHLPRDPISLRSVFYACCRAALAKPARSRDGQAHYPGLARNHPHHYGGGDCHCDGALLVHPEEGRLYALALAAVHRPIARHRGSALPARLWGVEGCARGPGRLGAPAALPAAAALFAPTRDSAPGLSGPVFGFAAAGANASILNGKIHSSCPIPLLPWHPTSASVLPPRPPAFCTSAAPAPLSSIGSMPATITGPWCCAWTTPTSSATPRPDRKSVV